MSNKIFINFCVSLRNASRACKPEIIVKSNKLVLKVVDCFYKEGFINGYSIINNYKIRIYLKFMNDKGLLNSLNNFKFQAYNFKQIKYLKNNTEKRSYYMLFSCIKGLVEYQELINLNIGGILILSIDLP